jgi:hypothetical protein
MWLHRSRFSKNKINSAAYMDTAQIDAQVLSVVKNRWTKVAMVIVKVAASLNPDSSLSDEHCELISSRIEALVKDGRLLAQGNTKNWRFSEVRLNSN